ncbi:cdc42 effector protein 1 [Cottoperca gobio]|uniref:Cdc42 effector protein 1 n=1 Tax=Cottoperca gobio TaxID=56716 RepID=A0A6J2RN72_COTGO|nr:cdc42 effector protein 1 [Cottoperca gobio]XP_029311467.1 cdc42 effector protein 1 [Cottoperca gobio]XP_029311468.1 cdc42 effector protein 1 [Cottoperca gobio]XP_029311469.1 cdc42 effector protein 1 [Cottoperca gobio]XP_029311470.1 cdc42 effector protein 1 [Cottoperca gobio]XP_029311471.1 cdc42 effector protein 1 [Cottoperca gobio]
MNLQEKLSGLKGLVSNSHSKRRFKGDLTLEMISPPLGDFRHTMHVGRGGDVFGDTSFLSNHGGTANRNNGNAGNNGNNGNTGNNGETDSISSPDNKIGAFFSRTLRQIRRGSENRPTGGCKDLSPPPPVVSPIVKNAISLPRLDVDLPNGSPTAKVLFPSSQSTPEERKSSYGLESGFVTLPRLSRSERQQPSISLPTSCSPNIHRGSLTDPTDAILSTCSASIVTSDPRPTFTSYSDSLTSLDTFTFDLGPSLMSEVFGLIDGHTEEHGHAWEGEEAGSACGLTNEGSEMDSATISYVDSLLREDCGGRKSPHGAEWEEDEGMEANRVKVPDVVMGSPERVRMGMESERFQSATDVLARHYGVSHLKGQSRVEVAESEMIISQPKNKMSYNYMDDEDEIKV